LVANRYILVLVLEMREKEDTAMDNLVSLLIGAIAIIALVYLVFAIFF
jgi:hypothetical protein